MATVADAVYQFGAIAGVSNRGSGCCDSPQQRAGRCDRRFLPFESVIGKIEQLMGCQPQAVLPSDLKPANAFGDQWHGGHEDKQKNPAADASENPFP